MAHKLPLESLYRIRDPKNFYSAMHADIELLWTNRRYVSLTTVIVCCLDALAADSGDATRRKFEAFVTKHLPDLCAQLQAAYPRQNGAWTLYDKFRNGFAHLRAPKPEFVIAEEHELNGLWAGRVEFNGDGEFTAINVDRLAREFLQLLAVLERSATSTHPRGEVRGA